uniref:Yippee domain-containing protein n=1 Tax=Parascaris equorum TaxID=6256 RepID=A0A914S0C1_PAREQ
MGRYFLEHLGGRRIFSCENCKAFLTNEDELISRHFTGSTGPAFLFERVVNVEYSETQLRTMITGRHIVRDVMCKRCKAKLGWMYEYAMNEPQKYKEAKVILEKALIEMSDGIDNPVEEIREPRLRATGRAYLFRRVVNIRESDVESREMMTGRHLVRDVFCKRCNTKLGWMYEFAVEPDQKYKEGWSNNSRLGRVILERRLVRESEEFDDSLAERYDTETSSEVSSITVS